MYYSVEKRNVMKRNDILRIIIAGICLALAYVLPFLTGNNYKLGSMLCLMHIPVLLCGFFCGWHWGLSVGAIAPLLRAFTLGAPALFPTAICMAFELATYGAVAGIMHKALPKKKPFIICSLATAMIFGRIVFGIVKYLCIGIKGSYAFNVFLTEAFVTALPGIIIQIVLIPVIVMVLDNKKVLNLND